MKQDLSLERVRELLDYDSATGFFTWRVRRSYRAMAGQRAGHADPRGYVYIVIGKYRYLAHRLAWFYSHGRWPPHQIDHINRNKTDNRLENLREATNSENHANIGKQSPKKNYRGVYKRVQKSGTRYEVVVTRYGQRFYVGMFSDEEEAALAYKAEARRLFGEYAGGH